MRLGNILMTFLMFSFSKLLKTKNKQIHIGKKKMNKKISFPQLKKNISNIIEIQHSNFNKLQQISQ